jgi:hypothetical protein
MNERMKEGMKKWVNGGGAEGINEWTSVMDLMKDVLNNMNE